MTVAIDRCTILSSYHEAEVLALYQEIFYRLATFLVLSLRIRHKHKRLIKPSLRIDFVLAGASGVEYEGLMTWQSTDCASYRAGGICLSKMSCTAAPSATVLPFKTIVGIVASAVVFGT